MNDNSRRNTSDEEKRAAIAKLNQMFRRGDAKFDLSESAETGLLHIRYKPKPLFTR
jgi:hypothetical protein